MAAKSGCACNRKKPATEAVVSPTQTINPIPQQIDSPNPTIAKIEPKIPTWDITFEECGIIYSLWDLKQEISPTISNKITVCLSKVGESSLDWFIKYRVEKVGNGKLFINLLKNDVIIAKYPLPGNIQKESHDVQFSTLLPNNTLDNDIFHLTYVTDDGKTAPTRLGYLTEGEESSSIKDESCYELSYKATASLTLERGPHINNMYRYIETDSGKINICSDNFDKELRFNFFGTGPLVGTFTLTRIGGTETKEIICKLEAPKIVRKGVSVVNGTDNSSFLFQKRNKFTKR